MPRQSTIKVSWGRDGIKIVREYRVTYTDDSEERTEAVRFFGKALFPASQIPKCTYGMSAKEAQMFLDEHPMQQQWQMLILDPRSGNFQDDDLHRLQYFPELEILQSRAEQITDRGVAHFRRIPGLRDLLLYSPLVTDACLPDIATLKQLKCLDLQGSHLISRQGFDRLVKSLKGLEDIYPPFDRPLSEVLAKAARASETGSGDSLP